MTRALAVTLLILVALSSAQAREWIPLCEAAPAAEAVSDVVSTDAAGTLIKIEVPGFFAEPLYRSATGAVALSIPGAVYPGVPGAPDLPVLSYTIAVPDEGRVGIEIVSLEERVLEGYDVPASAPYATEGTAPERAVPDAGIYGTDAYYPAEVASVGEPAVMRDLRLVPVRVNPVRYNPVSRTLSVVEKVTVRVTCEEGPSVNARASERTFRSEAFEPLYGAVVDNYDQLPAAETRRGSYLVITVDDYASQMGLFVEWKRQRGVETELVTLSEIGAGPTKEDIKSFIETAYYTWDNPPDYVMLVGDCTMSGIYGTLPTWYLPGVPYDHVTDHPYTELDGSDYLPDVIIGRMSVDNPSEATVASLKVLSYERDCDAADSGWYERALMVAGNYGEGATMTSPRQTVLRVREMLYDHGYAEVDTVFYPPYIAPNPISSIINSGVGIVNYRGWGNASGWHYPEYYVSDINALGNGKMLPIMTSVVCATGDFGSWGYDPCFAEAWIRSGSPLDLKGGPVAFAPSDYDTHTRWNNAVGSGFYQGLLDEGLEHFGQAAIRAKLEVWNWFVDEREPDDWVDYYFNVYNVMGDPELWVRTSVPDSFIVSHDGTVSLGDNHLEVRVTDSSGNVVPGAEVVLHKDGEFLESRTMPPDDFVLMPLPAESAGEVAVTVSESGFRPYTGAVDVVAQAQHVGYHSHAIDDDATGASSGNGDGAVSPGETIELSVTLKNYGTDPATGVTCSFDLLLPSPWADVATPQVASYGTVSGGATAGGSAPFVFDVLDGCPEGEELTFLLTATDGARSVWRSEVRVVVGAPALSHYSTVVIDGGDGVLDPGETANLIVLLSNDGSTDATSVQGHLVGPPSGLSVSDADGYWSSVTAGNLAANSGDQFTVTASSDVAVGHVFELAIDLSGDDGLAGFVVFDLKVGTPASSDPAGPDGHGYYCYDDTDTGYSEAPVYSWIEIDPSHGGSGTDLGMSYDEMVNVPLPFTFRYCGVDFDTIGICSNGNIGMGSQPGWEKQPRNTPIGAPLGPAGMIAPFWDDLDPGSAGSVLYDDRGTRFVVEWSGVQTAYMDTVSGLPYEQTFELILYDPAVYTTATGDGEIVFQYHTIANSDTANGATVGIENLTQTGGLEYSFFSMYPDECTPLAAGRAVKFTTDVPDAYPSTGVSDEDVPRRVTLERNRPNPFNPVTVIAYSVPVRGEVELSVYDISGRRVATLVNGEKGAGRHEAVWNGTNDAGERVASGVYFSRLEARGETLSSKMVLLK